MIGEKTRQLRQVATTPTQLAIRDVCAEVADILIEKNRAYGDSALDPVRVFSRADRREQLLVRLDDKLSRIARGSELGEDVILDLIGYLVLLRVGDRMAGEAEDADALVAEMVAKVAALPPGGVERVRPGRGPRRSEE